MKYLENFVIHRFRGLQDLELNNLGQINVLVGTNNSGKTSVLEAIALYCQPLNEGELIETSQRRETSKKLFTLDSLQLLFPKIAENHNAFEYGQIDLQSEGDFSLNSLTLTHQKIQGIPSEDILETIADVDAQQELYEGSKVEINAKFAVDDAPLKKRIIFWETASIFIASTQKQNNYGLSVKTITPISHQIVQLWADRYSELKLEFDSSIIDSVIDLIKLFDENIEDIEVLSTNGIPKLYFKHKKLGVIPLNVFGDGLRRVVSMALTLPQVKNGILLVDEIETAIHVSILDKIYAWLFKACQQYNIQLFATTHSLEAVDALLSTQFDSNSDDIVVFRLGGVSKRVKRFSGELLNHIRMERGLDVRG